jgi:hypothetical protein
LCALAALAFGLRLLMLLDAGAWGTEDVLIAEQIAAGNGFQGASLYGDEIRPTSQKSPAVAYLLALSMILAPGWPYAGFMVMQALAGALGCWWLARLGGETLGPRAGLLAALFAALFVPHIWWMRHLGEQIFAAAGMAGVMLLLYRAERTDRIRDAICWGMGLGASGYFSADLLLPAPLFALWFAWRRRRHGLWPALQKPAIAAVVAFAVLSPWTARNYLVHGELVLVRTGLGTAAWWGNNPDATGTDWFLIDDGTGNVRRVSGRYAMPPELFAKLTTMSEVDQESHLMGAALAWVRDNPGAAARLGARKFLYYWWFSDLNDREPVPVLRDLAWAAVLVFFLIGTVAALRRNAELMLPLLFPLATSTVIHVATVVSQNWRMRIPIEPIVLLLAAHGVLTAASLASRRSASAEQAPEEGPGPA